MLQLKDIRKSYPQANGKPLPILEIESYSLERGEQAVLVGRSGCGKTTMLHIISGIARADSGIVRVGDIEVSRLSEPGRDRFRAQNIGYVFQTFNLLPGFTALENILLGMTFSTRRPDRQRALALLDRVGLRDRAEHKPRALSVGEQQRVAVARALANRPKLLLADEPTANVDPANQQTVIDLIRESCREESITLLLVTHAVEVAAQFSRVDRLEQVNRILQHA